MCLMTKDRPMPLRLKRDRLAALVEDQRVFFYAALEDRIDCCRKTGMALTCHDQFKYLTMVSPRVSRHVRQLCTTAKWHSHAAGRSLHRIHSTCEARWQARIKTPQPGSLTKTKIASPRVESGGVFGLSTGIAWIGVPPTAFWGPANGQPGEQNGIICGRPAVGKGFGHGSAEAGPASARRLRCGGVRRYGERAVGFRIDPLRISRIVS